MPLDTNGPSGKMRRTRAGELPVLGPVARERADAARNRLRILEAAERLLSNKGTDGFSMDEVAAAAGVGVGTLYRRFNDRAALIYAVLDERERELQAEFLDGPPPLGPGAPPLERLEAFFVRYMRYLEEHTDLLLLADTTSAGCRFSGAYGAHRTHVSALIGQVDATVDTAYLADALLGVLDAELFAYQRRTRGLDLDRLSAGAVDLLRRLLGRE